MDSINRRQKKRRTDDAGWSSDEEYQESRGSEEDWRSDNDWNEDSSLAGEASAMSEGTGEEILEEEEKLKHKHSKSEAKNIVKLDLDDVGTEDDGESRHPEDITERSNRQHSKTNASDISDLSDIEEQIAEAQHKFMDDKQSLSGMIGLADEVTVKGNASYEQETTMVKSYVTGENLTRKASETSLVVERDTLKKGLLSKDQLSSFDDDDMSFRSYTDRTSIEDDVPQRDNAGQVTAGRIEYINDDENYERSPPKQTFAVGHIEYLDETKSNDSGSLISEPDLSISTNANEASRESRDGNGALDTTDNLLSHGESGQQSSKQSLKSSSSSETLISGVSTKHEVEKLDDENEIYHQADMNEKPPSEQEEAREEPLLEMQEDETVSNSPELKEFEEPECSKFGERHLCCFINSGGGGDDGRENGIVNRLKKLKDDIANMRKELNLARQECKKESEEVAKLIEAAAERNKAAENEISPTNSPTSLTTYTPQSYTFEEILPASMLAKATILPGRTQVPIPTSLLQDRLQATRQTASSTYRQSLNELERMVEKEMASIKDSMIRLEPLNKIAAEWEAVQPVRDPKRTTYTRDYRLEMVTSEMRLQAPDVKSIVQEIK